jgi:hypothetical protein
MGSKIEYPTYGRPRLLSPEYERELTRQAHVASMPGAKGRHYAMVAARALFDLDQPGWVPRDAVFAHFVKRNGDLKWSMLSELGRIDDEETVQAVAATRSPDQEPHDRDRHALRALPDHLGSGDCHRTRSGSRGRSSGFLRLQGLTQLWTGHVRQLRGR